MLPPANLVVALATALSGVPSMASAAAAGGAAEASPDATAVTLAAAAAAVAIGGLVLLAIRRRGAGNRMSTATAEKVTAVLTRRTLHRGRLRFDDEVMSGSRQVPARARRTRAKRRTG